MPDRLCETDVATAVYRQRHVICRDCAVRAEQIEFGDPLVWATRRLRLCCYTDAAGAACLPADAEAL